MKYLIALVAALSIAVSGTAEAPNKKSIVPYVRVSFKGSEFRAIVKGSDAVLYTPNPSHAEDGQLLKVSNVPRQAPVCIELEKWNLCAMRKPKPPSGIEL